MHCQRHSRYIQYIQCMCGIVTVVNPADALDGKKQHSHMWSYLTLLKP